MEPNRVVVKFKNNTVSKGKTNDFFPNKTQFHLEEMNGDIVEINVEDLKAVFFVKDFEGNKDHKDNYSDEIAAGGRKIKVVFLMTKRWSVILYPILQIVKVFLWHQPTYKVIMNVFLL